MSQAMRSLICLSLYFSGCEVSLLDAGQGYGVSNLFLVLCPWILDLWSLGVYVPMCELSDMFVGIFPNIWGLCGYIFLVGMFLSLFGYVFWGCEHSGPFVECVLQDIRTVLSEGVCPRVWGLCCVCGYMSLTVRSLKCLWVWFWRCKFPELSVGVCLGKWKSMVYLWECAFQNMRSQSCLSLCMSQYVRSVCMGIDQGYQFFDTVGLVLPREWGLWDVWGGEISHNVSSQVCLRLYDSLGVYVPWFEVSELFVDVYPKVWGLWSICCYMLLYVSLSSLVYIKVCLWVYFSVYEVPDLFLHICSKVRSPWYVSVCKVSDLLITVSGAGGLSSLWL